MLKFWQSISSREKWLVGISGFSIALALGILCSRLQLDAAMIAPCISAISAVAACIGAAIAYNNLRSNRAWMIPILPSVQLEHHPYIDPREREVSDLIITTDWENFGKSPARNLKFTNNAGVLEYVEAHGFKMPPDIDGHLLVGPGQNVGVSTRKWGKERAQAVMSGGGEFFIYSECTYNDIYSRKLRRTRSVVKVLCSVENIDGSYTVDFQVQATPDTFAD